MREYLWTHDFGDISCHHTRDKAPKDNGQMHTHDCLEIYYFISGNCTYFVEGTAYTLKPHDILFKRPLETHKVTVNSSDVPYERINISLPVDVFRSIDPGNQLFNELIHRPLGTGNRFTEEDFGHTICTELMERLAKDGAKFSRLELLSLTLLLCAEAARVSRNKRRSNRAGTLGTRLIDYVNDHLFSDISLQSISNEFYLSQSQINRIFHSHTGSSVNQYIITKRLLTARDVIRSGMSTSQACVHCGYNDYSAFYRAYLKRFGHPPQNDKKPSAD